MNPRKLQKLIKRAKQRNKTINDSKILDIKFQELLKHINLCIQNIRKQRPQTHNYRALVNVDRENKSSKHETVVYMKEKIILDNLVAYVYHSKYIQENYDRKTVEEYIVRKFKDFIYSKNLNKEEIAKDIIKYFECIHQWDFLFPLGNIELEIPYFRLGNHRIINFTKYRKQIWRKNIKYFFNKNQHPENAKPSLDLFEGDASRFLDNQICALIKVQKGDSEKALKEAKNEFRLFLNCIKYMSFQHYGNYKRYRILISGENFTNMSSYVGVSNTGGPMSSYENKNPMPFTINKYVNKRMQSNGINKLSNILMIEKEDMTQFQSSILTAINIYGDAVSDTDMSQAYIKFVTILEYLLVRKREAISYNLSERLSFLLNRGFIDRKKYFDYVKKLYQIRCNIVHEAKKGISKSEYNNIHAVVYNLLLLLINIHKKFRDKNEFLEKINEIKFGRKYTFQKRQVYIH